MFECGSGSMSRLNGLELRSFGDVTSLLVGDCDTYTETECIAFVFVRARARDRSLRRPVCSLDFPRFLYVSVNTVCLKLMFAACSSRRPSALYSMVSRLRFSDCTVLPARLLLTAATRSTPVCRMHCPSIKTGELRRARPQ
jgi:hypothetical protein